MPTPVTGNFWAKGYGEFDPDDNIIIPFDFTLHIAELETSYSSHVIEPTVGLTLETVTAVAGLIKIRVTKNPAETLVLGKKVPVTIQCVMADGQKYTKTLLLKVRQG